MGKREVGKMKKEIWIIVMISLVLLLVWSPWITKDFAERRVVDAFEKSQEGIEDGCGFSCPNCGVYSSSRAPFGYKVVILYSCGLKVYPPQNLPEFQGHAYVSPIGTVHSYKTYIQPRMFD